MRAKDKTTLRFGLTFLALGAAGAYAWWYFTPLGRRAKDNDRIFVDRIESNLGPVGAPEGKRFILAVVNDNLFQATLLGIEGLATLPNIIKQDLQGIVTYDPRFVSRVERNGELLHGSV